MNQKVCNRKFGLKVISVRNGPKNMKSKDTDATACEKDDEFVLFCESLKVQINELFLNEV